MIRKRSAVLPAGGRPAGSRRSTEGRVAVASGGGPVRASVTYPRKAAGK
ncbi:hypothetical protein Sros_3485 [Streptosporangium roseum DSM 43021]|uniref:Uncharacterized protein n=1 Tax=Streptosporangium roseum (strain ATCC 12428 / DSM 43021 / JCM 3005 / KCTC 9067 / NCIMB 10171 / NRRL 2505 / NI 9100) TaxID=479432 RepID=D2BF60_STRRD|nr:hypothetical protein Sros_3485 [Streptosporangium roseum DSM 43021]